ncbi:unnamed protein product [Brassica oleracea]
MSLSMRNESTLFARTTGLFTADMKLHLHKTFLNQMFGTWTDSLKALQTCAQVFLITLKIFTLSLGQGQEASTCGYGKAHTQ